MLRGATDHGEAVHLRRVLATADSLANVGLWTPHGDVDDRDGSELLAEARELFGDGMPDTDAVALPGNAPDQFPDAWLFLVTTAALGAGIFVTRRVAGVRSRS